MKSPSFSLVAQYPEGSVLAEFSLQWNLEEIFSSQQPSQEFAAFLAHQFEELNRARAAITSKNYDEVLAKWQMLSASLRHGFSYIACLGVDSSQFSALEHFQSDLIALQRDFTRLSIEVDALWAQMPVVEFDRWSRKKEYEKLTPLLRMRREGMLRQMGYEKELLALALAQESFLPLVDLYRSVVSRLAVSLPEGGNLSVFEAQSAMQSGPVELREAIFYAYNSCWERQATIFQTLLNQIYGYRLELLRQRKQTDPLEESLEYHGLSRSSVDAMWRVVNDKKASLILFLSKKGALLGHKKAQWSDIAGSLIQDNRTPLGLKDASDWVYAGLSRLGQEVGDFCRGMARKNQVTSLGLHKEGFPSSALPLPLIRQVRVFLGYSNGIERLPDFARQMIRAWHYNELFDQPEMLQRAPVIVSEALAVFSERLTLEVVHERAFTRQLQFDALFAHMQRALIYVLDMQVRYLFELRLFAQRAKGGVSATYLSELMRECQREAYAGQLANYFPHYWASKEHFYQTSVPAFQNYPLSMGFLLGLGLYRLYRQTPQGFCEKLKQWVRRSSCSVSQEALIVEIFGIRLHEEAIWNQAMTLLEEDMRTLGNLIDIKDRTFSFEAKGY